MNQDTLMRLKAAVSEEMRIDHVEDATYDVKDKYTVDLAAKRCECPDHEYRNHICKHLIAVELAVFFEEVPAPTEAAPTEARRPVPLMPEYDAIPAALADADQWVCWEYQRDSNPDHAKEWTKVPLNIRGGFASSTDASTWASFEAVKEYDLHRTERTDGPGFVVHKDDSFIGIDIDNCRDAETGAYVDGVADLIESGNIGSYAEVSPSGTGIRIFVRGDWPLSKNQSDLIAGDGVELEVYEWGRYLTVTGHHIAGTPTEVTDDMGTIDLFAGIMDPTYTPAP